MLKQVILTNREVGLLAHLAAGRVLGLFPKNSFVKIWGVPRGGVSAALAMVADARGKLVLVDRPEDAECFVDDLIDSGATLRKWSDEFPGVPFVALIDKDGPEYAGKWIVFPWEATVESSAEDIFVRLLQFVGEDPTREGLQETPARMAKAWQFWTKGYAQDPAAILKVFEDGAAGCDEMVVVKDIPIYSHCEHHLAAIVGTATIAYIPDGKIVGLSKLSRLADCFARRLQVQERLTTQIAEALDTHLAPKGVGVVIKARHLCMESRGVCQQGHFTVTSALRGVFRDDPTVRAEFMALAQK